MPDSPFYMARAKTPDGEQVVRAFFTVDDDDKEHEVMAWAVDVTAASPEEEDDA